jgi:hypothetical protein
MNNIKKLVSGVSILVMVLSVTSCKKFLEVGTPRTEIGTGDVFNSDIVAASAVLGIYNDLMASSSASLSVKFGSLLGQAADEMQTVELAPASNYFTNNLLANTQNDDFWSAGYRYIYYANMAIANLTASTALTPAMKKQLLGETYFVRAFMHFYLVNLFGDIPYVTSAEYQVTNNVARMPVDRVYEQIIADFKTAKTMLTDSFPDPINNIPPVANQERIRPNKGAAGAMLARVYLYRKDWVNAEAEADALIKNTANYNLVSTLDGVFLKNSRETIWALPTSDPTYPNTYDAAKYILKGAPSFFGQGVSLTNAFYNNAFEAGDKRKTLWTGSFTNLPPLAANAWYYPYKYKSTVMTGVPVEYWVALRLAEQYLIRAEARAQQEHVEDAVKDINELRKRARNTPADLPDYPGTISKTDCLNAIMQERRVEFFAEGGHRWLDLKRTGQADAVLGPLKGSTNWQTTDQFFPIPDQQLLFDPNMTGHQNLGY